MKVYSFFLKCSGYDERDNKKWKYITNKPTTQKRTNNITNLIKLSPWSKLFFPKLSDIQSPRQKVTTFFKPEICLL